MTDHLLDDAARTKTIEDMFDLAGASVSPSIARLIGCDGGESIEICDEVHTVGRSQDLPLGYKINHPRLSSLHCEFHLDKVTNKVFLLDRSTNGVFVNGARVEKGKKIELDAGDTISFLNKGVESTTKLEYLFQRLKKVVDSSTLIEELSCAICKNTLYDPCSALPCLHTFCSGCISGWIKHSSTCPECRVDLYEVRPSHKVANLVSELLKTRPDLKRSEKDIKELEENSSVPPTGIKLKGKKRAHGMDDDGTGPYGSDDEDDSLDMDSDEDDSDEEDEEYEFYHPHTAGPPGSKFYASHMGFGAKLPSACPQCHAPGPDGFQCPPGGCHLACMSCKTAFPDRPLSSIPQKCYLCSTAFCDLYLGGCKNPAGVGYLQPVKDHKMDSLPVGSLFNRNMVEQDILQRYMSSAGIGPGTAWVECLRNFEKGDWLPNVASVRGPLTTDVTVCRPCCLRIYASMLYHYRRAIPRDALPPAVAARPDCWYGMECRTMHKNAVHAQRYNHVCATEKRKE